jgi:4-hydroxy-tetrahydrodipicolinate synthase
MLHFTYSAINPVATKSLMQAMGMPSGPLRKPLTALEGAALENGLNVAARLGLDKIYGYKLGAARLAA